MANKTLIATLTGDTFVPAAGFETIVYVGGKVAGTPGTGGGSIAINSGLTGGIGSAAAAGDLVIVTVMVGTAARQPTIAIATPSGYTANTVQRTTASTADTNVQSCYKIMPGTPDTAVTIPASGNAADGIAYAIQVFRNVDPTTPMDVTATYATGSGTNNRPNGASITPVTTGAWIVVAGGGAAGTGTTLFTAGSLIDVLSANGADTTDGTVGVGYTTSWVSGAYDPAVFGGGNVNAANSWGCTTMALRPKATTPFDTARQAGIDGVVSAQSETNGFNNKRSGIAVTALVRTSDTVVTLTIPSLSTYDITAQEVLTWTLPGSILASGIPIVATPTFTIDPSGGVVNLVLADALVVLSMESPTLLQANTLVVQDLLIGLSAESPSLTQQNTLAVQDALIALAAENPTLSVTTVLAVQNALIALNMDSPVLTQANVLAVQDALIALTAESPSLNQANVLVVQNALIALSAENVALTQANVLAVQDALVALNMEAPALVQQNTLAVQDALIALAADNVTLESGTVLAVQDALVALAMDSPALNQANALAVQNALVALAMGSPALTQANVLAVQDALIALGLESPTILDGGPLEPALPEGVDRYPRKGFHGGLLYWLKLLKELQQHQARGMESEAQHAAFIAERSRIEAKIRRERRVIKARAARELRLEQEDEEHLLNYLLLYLDGSRR